MQTRPIKTALEDRWIFDVFDKSPLAIAQMDPLGQIKYMNNVAMELSGLRKWRRKSIEALFPDVDNRAIVREQLARRNKGFSDEYEVELTRHDNGARVPIKVAAMPIMGEDGLARGLVSIFRSIEIEKAIAAFNECLASSDNPRVILKALAEETRKLIPFDLFTATQFSRDMKHSRILFDYPENAFGWGERWFAVSTPTSPTSERTTERLDEIYQRTGHPVVKRMMREGFQWIMRCPVFSQKRLIGSVNLVRKKAVGFSSSELKIFQSLPIGKALLTALLFEGKRETEFRLDLIKAISVCESAQTMSEIVVSRLSEYYGWSHVSIFWVDEPQKQIVLQSQKGASNQALFPAGYRQAFEQGVLGFVREHGKDENIGNVKKNPTFSKIFIKSRKTDVTSELCMRILADGRVSGLLNVEDVRENAFSPEEVGALRIVLDEIGEIMERRRKEHLAAASLDVTPTAVFVLNQYGVISVANRAASELLGYTINELVGTSFEKYCKNRHAAQAVVLAHSPCGELDLVLKSGRVVEVTIGGRLIGSDTERKLVTARDLSQYRRSQDFELIAKMYSEVATQAKTPLSLAHNWLTTLLENLQAHTAPSQSLSAESEPVTDSVAIDSIDKAIAQLTWVDLTLNRLALYDLSADAIPFHRVKIYLPQFLQDVLDVFPKAAQEQIQFGYRCETTLIDGDTYQLGFVVRSLLGYLIRFAPHKQPVDFHVEQHGVRLSIVFQGVAPEREKFHPAKSPDPKVSTLLSEMALGEKIIKRFLKNHGAQLVETRLNHSFVRFQCEFEV
jgi:PAS domain S-box-containing protein